MKGRWNAFQYKWKKFVDTCWRGVVEYVGPLCYFIFIEVWNVHNKKIFKKHITANRWKDSTDLQNSVSKAMHSK